MYYKLNTSNESDDERDVNHIQEKRNKNDQNNSYYRTKKRQ